MKTFLGVRWTKLARDLRTEKERIVLMLAAIAVSLVAVGAVLGGYAILTREIAQNYLNTHPADATLELPGGVDAAVIEVARHASDIGEVEARDVILARAQVGNEWRPLLLFVVDAFQALRLNSFRPVSGSWPPPPATMLIERTATGMLNADVGGKVRVKTAHGTAVDVEVAGLVHDPGLAPAWQERTGYGYISRATLKSLGEEPVLHELRITLLDRQAGLAAIEAAAGKLAQDLRVSGRAVHEIRVPPPRQHPHQRQMTTILFLMLAFSVMSLVLSGVLVASSLAAMLARQVREIGVMKTVGARTGQITAIYAGMVVGIGAVAVVLAVPAGLAGAHILSNAVAGLLNFTIDNATVPAWIFGVQALAGILVPLLVAMIPIRRASRMSVRNAMDQHGAAGEKLRSLVAVLPKGLRSAVRRPVRLGLTVALLATGGAMFMTALNVSASWERTIAKVYETRHYDIDIRFHEAQPKSIMNNLLNVPGVAAAEAWGYSPAAFSRPGQIDVVRTYPDRGHASFAILAPPADTRLVSFPVIAGRWLRDGDTNAVVLNHAAAAQAPWIHIGDTIDLSIDGQATTWRVVGIVEEIGSAGVAYVTDHAFARVTGTADHSRMLRVVTQFASAKERGDVVHAIETKLSADGAGVETAMPLAELRTAMADHIVILIRALIAMAAVMATVGGLGLSSAMSISVLERTREFGVMKTVGATPARITRIVVGEALAIATVSWVAAICLAIPLTALVDTLVGNLGFVAPLPLIIAPAPTIGWLLMVWVVSCAATLIPARRASRLPVAAALAYA